MKGLSSRQDGGEPVDAGPRYVIEGILLGKTPSGSLTVRPEGHRLWIFWLKGLNDLCPEQAGHSHLGDLHKKIHTDAPKEGYPRGKVVNSNSRLQSGTDIFQPVRQGVGQFQVRRCAGFMHVIAANADAVELRH